MAIDAASNLYGTNPQGGSYGYGAVFELSPSAAGWTYTDLYDFTGGNDGETPLERRCCDQPRWISLRYDGVRGANGVGVIYKINLGARGRELQRRFC